MTRPSQIRQIVAELRRALGPEPSGWELLRLAAYIVEAHREPEVFDYDDPDVRSPFFALEVDTAFENEWKVLDFERRQGMSFGDELSDEHYRVEARIRNFIGRTSWPHTGTD